MPGAVGDVHVVALPPGDQLDEVGEVVAQQDGERPAAEVGEPARRDVGVVRARRQGHGRSLRTPETDSATPRHRGGAGASHPKGGAVGGGSADGEPGEAHLEVRLLRLALPATDLEQAAGTVVGLRLELSLAHRCASGLFDERGEHEKSPEEVGHE